MSQPFVGEIRMGGWNFAPQGWAFCDGQVLSIAENSVLFNLIGTTYGGDGQTTFALPDLRGRVPIHQGQGPGLSSRAISQSGGEESVSLALSQIPSHSHALQASANASTAAAGPAGNLVANAGTTNVYASGPPGTDMSATAVGSAGGSQPHNNLAPYQCVSYIISLFGVFPSQN
jgi:microcystin-dependent protein